MGTWPERRHRPEPNADLLTSWPPGFFFVSSAVPCFGHWLQLWHVSLPPGLVTRCGWRRPRSLWTFVFLAQMACVLHSVQHWRHLQCPGSTGAAPVAVPYTFLIVVQKSLAQSLSRLLAHAERPAKYRSSVVASLGEQHDVVGRLVAASAEVLASAAPETQFLQCALFWLRATARRSD